MELEDLKNIWRSKPDSFQQKGEAEIAAMLNGKSKSIISKLKQSVWIELVVTFLAAVGLLIYALTLPAGALKWTSVAILVIFVGYTVYYIKKLLILNQYSAVNQNIRSNLEQLIEKLTSYLKFYQRSYTVLYPVYFGLGILFSGIEQGTDHFIEIIGKPKTILYLLAFGVLFYIGSTWLVKWLFKKLYGNHIVRLTNLLAELSPEEPMS
jgi:hypothetical protein